MGGEMQEGDALSPAHSLPLSSEEDSCPAGTLDCRRVLPSRPPAPGEMRSTSGFVGLKNQGATCYLNSLIQQLYLTPELRAGIYALTEEDLGLTEEEDEDEDASAHEQVATPAAPRVNPVFLAELTSMGFAEPNATHALQQTMEGGHASVQRAAEWLLMHCDEDLPAPTPSEAPPAPETESERPVRRSRRRKILIELQTLFARLQAAQKRATSTRALTRSFGWTGGQIGEQHDVHELNRILFDAIETSLRGTPESTLLDRLFRGTFVNQTRCLACGRVSEREEPFLDVTTIVKGQGSLVHALHALVEPERLEGANRYFCEACDAKQEATRQVSFRDTPDILIFSLARLDYDLITGHRVKNSEALHYPLSLHMAPYREGAPPQPLPAPEVRKAARKWSLFDPPVPEDAREEDVYDLCGVVIHTGRSGNHGHYHAYLKDLAQEGHWAYRPPSSLDKYAPPASLRKGHTRSASDERVGPSGGSSGGSSGGLEGNKENQRLEENLPSLASLPLRGGEGPVCTPQTSVPSSLEREPALSPPSSQGSGQGKKGPPAAGWPEDESRESGWFDFNDASVTPIPLRTLRSQFGGKTECAYMLAYRRRGTGPSSSSSSLPLAPHLQAALQQQNEKLQSKWEASQQQAHRMEVTVFTGAHFQVDCDGIARFLPLAPPHAQQAVLIDQRQSLGELHHAVCQALGLAPDTMQLHAMRVQQQRLVLPAPDQPLGPEDLTLAECGLAMGSELLLWDGARLAGRPWNPHNQVLSLTLYALAPLPPAVWEHTLFLGGTDPSRLVQAKSVALQLTGATPLARLYQLAAEALQVDVGAVLLCSFRQDPSGPLEQPHALPPYEPEREDSLRLRDLHITPTSSTLSAEVREPLDLAGERENKNESEGETASPLGGQSWAQAFVDMKRELVCLQVKNNLFGGGMHSADLVPVIAPQATTLHALKRALLERLQLAHKDPDQVRFRRMRPEGFSGTLYQNESLPLSDVPLVDGTLLILENGESPSSQTVAIQWRLSHLEDVGEQQAVLPKAWTVREVIAHLKSRLDLPTEEQYVLQKIDIWGNVTRSYSDEARTVQDLAIHSGASFLLHKLTPGGQISVSLLLFEYRDREAPTPIPSSYCDRGVATEEQAEKDSAGEGEGQAWRAAMMDEEAMAEPWELYSVRQCRDIRVPASYFVSVLGTFALDKGASLLQLKEQISRLVPLLAGVSSPLCIRLWHQHTLLKGHASTPTDRMEGASLPTLVLQVLEQPEDLLPTTLTLTLFLRHSPTRSFLRPAEYVHEMGAPLAPRLAHDMQIPPEQCQAFHYSYAHRTWRKLDERCRVESRPSRPPPSDAGDLLSSVSERAIGDAPSPSACVGAASSSEKGEGLATIGYEDGDMIVVKDLRTDPTFADPLSVESLSQLHSDGSSIVLRPSASARKWGREEAQLRIHVDPFDDSHPPSSSSSAVSPSPSSSSSTTTTKSGSKAGKKLRLSA